MSRSKWTIALALALLLALATFSAQAATSGSCGTNATWTLDSAGKLTISGTGTLTDSESDTGSPFYSNKTSIKTVEVQSGITWLGGLRLCALHKAHGRLSARGLQAGRIFLL